MRTLTDHIVEGDSANHQIRIEVLDEPGQGGANHFYDVNWNGEEGEPAASVHDHLFVRFQNGPIKEFGVNGITQEALLAIVIDRLRSFQAGPYACVANESALSHCTEALFLLQDRTRARIARGVEGTHEK